MKILHTPYHTGDIKVHMVAGETLMLFHNDERMLVADIIQGMLELLDENEQDARATLTEVYEHVRAPDKKEVN